MEIPPSITPRIQHRLDSGAYETLEDLLDAALTSLEESEDEDLQEIRALVQEGIDDLEKYGSIPADQVLKGLREHQARFRDKSAS